MNNNNNRLWKIASGILASLLVVAVIALINNGQRITELRTTQVLMAVTVDGNAQWIRDWSTVLRVPERDQRQDSAIEELLRRVASLEQMVDEMERSAI